MKMTFFSWLKFIFILRKMNARVHSNQHDLIIQFNELLLLIGHLFRDYWFWSFGHFHNYWLLAMTCFSFDKAAAYGGHWWRTVGRGGGGQEMTKTVKLKRFYCHGQISALGTNSSKLVEIRMMTLKNHQSTAGPVPTCYTPLPPE